MGVLNVTPDSFFDGGRFLDHEAAIAHGHALIAEGADLIDIGGESTRPGATPVDVDEELRRVVPVVRALAPSIRVSIDTSKAEVAQAAVEAGATLINDVSATLAEVAAAASVGFVAMHRRGSSATMQDAPEYGDVVDEITAFLCERAATARALGVTEVYVDPGIGFGKTLEHNLDLLAATRSLVDAGEAVLVGTSRKTFLGRLLDPTNPRPPEERFAASLSTAVYAMVAGAAIVRVHDVRATAQAARLVGEHPLELVS
jgi:dihydropteroate synthase